MKYPILETIFTQELDEETEFIINKYWKMDNGLFAHTPTELRTKLNITQYKLNSIVKNNSKTELYLDDCVECKKPIIIPVTSQSAVKSKIEHNYYQCDECRNNLKQQLKKVDYLNQKAYRLEYALIVQYWHKLTEEELKVLKIIIGYNDYRTFYNKVLKENFDYCWIIVEKLDKLSLIEIKRDVLSNQITSIYFLPKLANALGINRGSYLSKNSNPNLSQREGRTISIKEILNQIK